MFQLKRQTVSLETRRKVHKAMSFTFAIKEKYNILAKCLVDVPGNRQNFDDLIGWGVDRDTDGWVMSTDHELFI